MSTATDSMFEHDDDDVPARFIPRYICTTPEISSPGRLMKKRASLGRKRSRNNYLLTIQYQNHLMEEIQMVVQVILN
jgi:hypothetical protein